MDTEQTIATDGTPVPIKSTTLSNFFDTAAVSSEASKLAEPESITLSNFFDDIVMVDETSRKPKYVCEGCAG